MTAGDRELDGCYRSNNHVSTNENVDIYTTSQAISKYQRSFMCLIGFYMNVVSFS